MVGMPLKKERIGETEVMNNGLKATIIAYRKNHDLDVRFEDGTIVYSRQYGDFKKGTIANPNYRVGETRCMTCGMAATIIAYRNAKDLDVRFEDDTIVKHRQYSNFISGTIKNPNFAVSRRNMCVS